MEKTTWLIALAAALRVVATLLAGLFAGLIALELLPPAGVEVLRRELCESSSSNRHLPGLPLLPSLE